MSCLTEDQIKELYPVNPFEALIQTDEIIKETHPQLRIKTLKIQKNELLRNLEKIRDQFSKKLISLEQIVSFEVDGEKVLEELDAKIQLVESALYKLLRSKKILKQRCQKEGWLKWRVLK